MPSLKPKLALLVLPRVRTAASLDDIPAQVQSIAPLSLLIDQNVPRSVVTWLLAMIDPMRKWKIKVWEAANIP